MTDLGHGPVDHGVLSVVIVTYNEADRVRACIESVLSASRHLADVEVILVDSNSTDGTVDIATEYPTTVLRIPDDDLASPGAGRRVGTGAASGDPILFVDGDMLLQRRWLDGAPDTLRSRPDVAAVDGQRNDPASSGRLAEVDAVRGVALYRRDPLRAVGGFDPYLQSLEDIHHVLYYADLYVGDSGTMSTEATMLGTPTIRANTMVDDDENVFRVLEDRYGLMQSFADGDRAVRAAERLLADGIDRAEWRFRRDRLVAERPDVTEHIVERILESTHE